MKQEIFEKILVSLYPNEKIIIKEFVFHDRYEFDDDMNLIPIDPAIFVGIQFWDGIDPQDIENVINKFTSKDFNIYNI